MVRTVRSMRYGGVVYSAGAEILVNAREAKDFCSKGYATLSGRSIRRKLATVLAFAKRTAK